MDFEPKQIRISPIPKTWILDLDGTLVVHDGPYIMGKDKFLPGAREFLDSIPREIGSVRPSLSLTVTWEQITIKSFVEDMKDDNKYNNRFSFMLCSGSYGSICSNEFQEREQRRWLRK